MSEASDAGADFFNAEPELLAAAVWHAASRFSPDRDVQREFVNGYISARLRRDEYRKEKTSAPQNE